MAFLSFLVLLAIPPASAHFNVEDLARLLRERQPRTLEETLPLLPADFRRNPVLMRSSRSLQSGSPEAPRAILSNADGSFILSFNGGGDTFEMIQFHADRRRFEFAEVIFERGHAPELVREATRCAGCHGSMDDPRPIFESFPAWPGAYGETGERLEEREEAPLFRSFLARAANDPRYRHLLDLDRTHLARGADGRMAGRPNSSLLRKLARLHFSRVADRVVAEPRYPSFRYDLLATLYCVRDPGFRRDFLTDAGNLPDELVGFEEEANPYRSSAIAFYWLLARRGPSSGFGWTLAFADMMSARGVRLPPADATCGTSTEEIARAFAARDPEVAALVGADGRRVPDCATLKALRGR